MTSLELLNFCLRSESIFCIGYKSVRLSVGLINLFKKKFFIKFIGLSTVKLGEETF